MQTPAAGSARWVGRCRYPEARPSSRASGALVHKFSRASNCAFGAYPVRVLCPFFLTFFAIRPVHHEKKAALVVGFLDQKGRFSSLREQFLERVTERFEFFGIMVEGLVMFSREKLALRVGRVDLASSHLPVFAK